MFFCFFKQKTAYDMRISDWSSDVCSSDLSSDSLRLQLGPSLRWPIFSGGRIRAQIRAADARADGAKARYERAVLSALSDSETSISRYISAGKLGRASCRERVCQYV